MVRSRFLIILLVGLVLTLAAQFGQNEYTPGTEVRFVQLGVKNGIPEGMFSARINGECA